MANRNGHVTDDITLPERSSHMTPTPLGSDQSGKQLEMLFTI